MITAKYLAGRVGFHKFPRLKRMTTISKSIPRNVCKVGIPGSGSFYTKSMTPSFLSSKTDLRSLATDAFQQSWKHRRLLYTFPRFSIIEKVLSKVKTENVDVILTIPSWPAQPWYSQVLELSVTKPLLLPQLNNILVQGDPQKCPYFSLAINFTKLRKPSRFFLCSYWKFIEFFRWKAF